MQDSENEASRFGRATAASAERYSNTNRSQTNAGARLTSLLEIKEGDVVLVPGCGPGTDTLPISTIVGPSGKVIGIDLDKHSISKANERLVEALQVVSTVTHKIGDACDLSTELDNTYTAIHVNAAYHFFKDRLAFLRGAYRSSKFGACMAISILSGDNPMFALQIRNDVLTEIGHDAHNVMRFPGKVQLEKELTECGWKDVKFSKFYCKETHDGLDSMLDWLETSAGNRWVEHLGEDRDRAHRMIEHEIAGLIRDDGSLDTHMCVYLISAKKLS